MAEDIEQIEEYERQTSRLRRRATLFFVIAVVVGAAIVVPPLISVNRYQRQITSLMTHSLGRPVRLSSVNLKLLPRPGFVLSNLSVGEAPEFGVEPILSAQTVVASIRLSALLTGKVEVDRISLDEASLNLVQATPGRWNLESIMMGGLVQGMTQTSPTASRPAFSRKPAAFPYLEATNSRVNLKRGLEKDPYSLINTQLSFWQESPGVWRLRLRGQPARTDMEISTADTGDLRLEATLQTLPGHGLYQMPLKVQAEWREAQLGSLSRLLLGSDQGWRGDLTADLNVQGTADAAQTRTRLRATSVRREEFVPASPMDFDINCALLYEHTKRAIQNLDCDTGVGDGKLHLKANLPGADGRPEATLAVDQLPLQAGLDMLRTLRSGFAPGVAADGKVSGELNLSSVQPAAAQGGKSHGPAGVASAKEPHASETAATSQGATLQASSLQGSRLQGSSLQGSLTVADGALHGGALGHPLALPKIVLTAGEVTEGKPAGGTSGSVAALSTHFVLALAAPANAGANTAGTKTGTQGAPVQAFSRAHELAVRLQLTADGYQIGASGTAAPERLRELAYALGTAHSPALDSVAEGQADLQLMASGPWVISQDYHAIAEQPAQPAKEIKAQAANAKPGNGKPTPTKAPATRLMAAPMLAVGDADAVAGTIQLHHVAWSAPYLARAVQFPEAIAVFSGQNTGVSGSFVYGALQGTASVSGLGPACPPSGCVPQVQISLPATDAATVEGALLGAPEKKSLLSPLIDRVRSSQPAAWPTATVNLQAESLVLGPVTLHKPVLAMKLTSKELTLESWQANLLGGAAKGDGSCAWSGNQLHYKLAGSFTGLSGAQLGVLLSHPAPSVGEKPAKGESGGDDGDEQPVSAPAAGAAWGGGPVDGSGTVELSGLTAKELAGSAAGTLHFHWVKGTAPVSAAAAASATGAEEAASAKATSTMHFDAWAGDATIGSGKIELGSNTLTQGKNASSVAGSVPFGGPAKLTTAPAKPQEAQAKATVPAKPSSR